MSTITIVRGVSGSGKSSLVRWVFDDRATHLEADMYFMKDGKYKFNQSRLKDAHEWCQRQTEESMKNKENIVVSNTFTTEWELKPYLDLAEKYRYTVFTLVVENRHGNNDVHDVPIETRQKQAERLSKSIKLI